eukprot:TRINITY_DN8102_c0_g1_i1.p1 TRINITY_DN8102_c0_g1~~TRINITY_DN8102_c0_g1_i1.p1  ORF type:complete len:1020 (+),score=267.51 TRINITY_DN8102_c0_g1_i1:157-3060(+)
MDPYVMLRLSDGRMVLLEANKESLMLEAKRTPLGSQSLSSSSSSSMKIGESGDNVENGKFQVIAFSLFRDEESVGFFSDRKSDKTASSSHHTSSSSLPVPTPFQPASSSSVVKDTPASPSSSSATRTDIDDEDDFIFGSASDDAPPPAPAPTPVSPPPPPPPPATVVTTSSDQSTSSSATTTTTPADVPPPPSSPIYVILARVSGLLEIYRLPDCQVVFSSPNFLRLPQVIQHQDSNQGIRGGAGGMSSAGMAVRVTEVSLHFYESGSRYAHPYVMAITDMGDLVVYQGFRYEAASSYISSAAGPSAHSSEIRFVRVELGLMTRPLPTTGTLHKSSSSTATTTTLHPSEAPNTPPSSSSSSSSLIPPSTPSMRASVQSTIAPFNPAACATPRRIRPFEDIGGKRGVFVTGPQSVWIFSTRNFLRAYPMLTEIGDKGVGVGVASCFTEFHNVACPHGFIYLSNKGVVSISLLPSHINTQLSWPLRKVPLKATPHKVLYHADSKSYIVVASTMKRVEVPEEEDEPPPPEENPFEQDEDALRHKWHEKEPTLAPRFELRIMAPNTWEVYDTFECDQFEDILSVKVVNLKVDGKGIVPFLAVGTGYAAGEDIPVKGRVLIFEILRSSFEFANQLNKPKLRLVHALQIKGVASVIAEIQGFLLTCVGPKLIVYHFQNGKDLVGTAFFDAQVYIASISVAKCWIMMGDLYKGVYFLRWREEGKQLILLGKDFDRLEVFSTDYLIDQQQLGLLVSDSYKNLQIFSYVPQEQSIQQTNQLTACASFHVGSQVNSLIRVPLGTSTYSVALESARRHDKDMERKDKEEQEKRIKEEKENSIQLQMQLKKEAGDRSKKSTAEAAKECAYATLFGTLDGGLGYLRPVDEYVYRKLDAVQKVMVAGLPHLAGLNPRAFRTSKTRVQMSQETKRNILDGVLLWKYPYLDRAMQTEIAQSVGSTPDQLMNVLNEMDHSLHYF